MPRPGPRRPLVALRIAEEDIGRLDELAERDGVNRSEIVRRLLEYGMTRMPAGWQPDGEATGGGTEARRNAPSRA